jgi:hypothetical protein
MKNVLYEDIEYYYIALYMNYLHSLAPLSIPEQEPRDLPTKMMPLFFFGGRTSVCYEKLLIDKHKAITYLG